MELLTHSAMIADEKPAARRPAKTIYSRSRISNGRDLLPDVDGRSLIARRYRDIVAAILVDQGGAANCSETRAQLIRRFAAASVMAEQAEAALARGERVDIAEHAALSSTAVRLAARIGLDRVPRDATTLAQYLASRELEAPSASEGEVGGTDSRKAKILTSDAPSPIVPPSSEKGE